MSCSEVCIGMKWSEVRTPQGEQFRIQLEVEKGRNTISQVNSGPFHFRLNRALGVRLALANLKSVLSGPVLEPVFF